MPDSDLHSVRIHLDGGLGRTISFHVFYTMQGNSRANTWAKWHLGIGWWGIAFALKLWPDAHTVYDYTDVDRHIDELALFAVTGMSLKL